MPPPRSATTASSETSPARRSCRPSEERAISRADVKRVYVRCYRDKQTFEEIFQHRFGLPAGRVVAYYTGGPISTCETGHATTSARSWAAGTPCTPPARTRSSCTRPSPAGRGNERITTCFANEAVRWGALRFGFSEAQALRARNLALTYTRLFAPPGYFMAKPNCLALARRTRVARPPGARWLTPSRRRNASSRGEREELKERLEREHGELLQELRALIPGAQVLFGFLLAIRFTEQFGDLTDTQRYVYYVTLLSTAAALVFFLAPSAYHRVRFRAGDKEYMVSKGNREAIAGSVATSIAIHGRHLPRDRPRVRHRPGDRRRRGFFALIAWLWWAIALYRALSRSRRQVV